MANNGYLLFWSEILGNEIRLDIVLFYIQLIIFVIGSLALLIYTCYLIYTNPKDIEIFFNFSTIKKLLCPDIASKMCNSLKDCENCFIKCFFFLLLILNFSSFIAYFFCLILFIIIWMFIKIIIEIVKKIKACYRRRNSENENTQNNMQIENLAENKEETDKVSLYKEKKKDDIKINIIANDEKGKEDYINESNINTENSNYIKPNENENDIAFQINEEE